MRTALSKSGRDETGMAVMVVIGILSIILIFVAGNLRMLYLLRNDLRLIDRQQTSRLASVGLKTNLPPITNDLSGANIPTAPAPQTK